MTTNLTGGKTCVCGADLVARIVSLESSFIAFKELMNERDSRYALRAKTQDTAVAAALTAADKAATIADAEKERRLAGLNEIKGMAENQARTFARAEEVKLVQAGFDTRLNDQSRIIAQISARGSGMKDLGAVLIGGGGLLIAALTLFFHR